MQLSLPVLPCRCCHGGLPCDGNLAEAACTSGLQPAKNQSNTFILCPPELDCLAAAASAEALSQHATGPKCQQVLLELVDACSAQQSRRNL